MPTTSPTSRNVTSPVSDIAKELRRAQRWSALGLVLIALASVLVGVWAAGAVGEHPHHDTLRYELAKTAMQVFAVAVLGSVAAVATFVFQNSRLKQIERREREEDRRARQDDLLRSLLQETLATYNQVKRTRRLLTARIRDDRGGHVRLDDYDEHMTDLMDSQLQFEQLKRRAPFIDDDRLQSVDRVAPHGVSSQMSASTSLAGRYEHVEKYLNHVIDEYKDKRYLVAAENQGLPFSQFDRLQRFISKRSCDGRNGFQEGFEDGAATPIDEIIKLLQPALAQPLRRYSPD
jgi:hypothetical protein